MSPLPGVGDSVFVAIFERLATAIFGPSADVGGLVDDATISFACFFGNAAIKGIAPGQNGAGAKKRALSAVSAACPSQMLSRMKKADRTL